MKQAIVLEEQRKAAAASAFAMAFIAAAIALLVLFPEPAHASTTLHKDGFDGMPAQYIVFDNLDISKATFKANNSAFSKKTNYKLNNGQAPSAGIVWNRKTTGKDSISSPFTITFKDAGYETDTGKRVDLVLSCKSVTSKKIRYLGSANTQISLVDQYSSKAHFEVGNLPLKGYKVTYGIKQTYDVRVYYAGTTTTAKHPLLFYISDLDTVDSTLSSDSYSGAYAEGVNLTSGYGKDTYVASNTKLAAESGNTRFRGTAGDSGSARSAVAFTLNASGGRIAWTGSNDGCATWFFESFVKTITASSGANGSIKASGTNKTIAAGKSLAEKVGWRTDKTYTATPAAGYKIASLKADGKAVAVKDSSGQSYTFGNVKADHTFAATFAPISYTVSFDGNGATSGSTPAMTGLAGATSYNLTANGFSRTGYSFAGWNTKADGSGTPYADGAGFKNLAAKDGGSVTLYAQWTPHKLTVNFHAHGATWDDKANAEVTDQLLASWTCDYDGADFAEDGLPNADGGTWGLSKPGFHATAAWIVGSGESQTRVSADERFATVQECAAALGADISSSDATVDLYAAFEPDPFVQRTVVVRIPQADYDYATGSSGAVPTFMSAHTSSRETVRALIDFSDSIAEDGYAVARATVDAPAEAACTLLDTARFSIESTVADGPTTVFTLSLSHCQSHMASTSAVNHIVVEEDGTAHGERDSRNAKKLPDLPLSAKQPSNAFGPAPAQEGNGESRSGDRDEPAAILADGATVNALIPDDVRHVVFSDSAVPDSADSSDISSDESGSVMGYYDEATATYTITTANPGKPVAANEDSSALFAGKKLLETIDTANFDLSKAKDVSGLFAGCEKLEELDASEWDTTGIENAGNMFGSCESLRTISFGPNWSYGHVAGERPTFPAPMKAQGILYGAGQEIPEGAGTYLLAGAEGAASSAEPESQGEPSDLALQDDGADAASPLAERIDSASGVLGDEEHGQNETTEDGSGAEGSGTPRSKDGQ